MRSVPRLGLSVLLALGAGGGLGALSAAEDGYETGRAGWGAFLGSVPLDIQADLDLVPGEGNMVLFVRPGSTADQLGLNPGDIVLDINGTPVSHRRDVRGVVRGSSPGEALEVTAITAEGRITTLDGTFAERQPRRGGPTPGWWNQGGQPSPWANNPHRSITGQRAQLAAEQAALERITGALAAIRAELLTPTRTSAWRFSFTCSVGTTP